MLRPICYERVSSIQQIEEGGGLDDQRSALEGYLDRNSEKFSADRVFIQDKGLSAFKNSNISAESQLGIFLQDVQNRKYGEGDALIVMSLDRISRRSSWAEDTIRFIVNSGIEVHDISASTVLRKDDPHSKLIMELIQMRSHNESLMKSVRAKAAWDRKIIEAVQNGTVISNKMPMWLKNVDNKYQVIQEKADLIVRCFEWYRDGLSTGEIVKRIGDPKWQMVTVSRLVRDRRLLGEHKRYNDEVVRNVYPQVINDDLFLTANRMMDRVMLEKKKPAEDLLLESDVVQKIFQLYESGFGSGAIVKRLPKGWSTVNVLRVLRDKKVVTQKIIDNLTFERVNQKLSMNGVANRIRKDLTISQDDYITNLFPKILKCGYCGGNIAIHYNHVRTKYVICRNREERKICDAKSVQYIRIEKNILECVKNVDFQKLMMESTGNNISALDSLREELSALRKEEDSYNQKINERKAAGKRVGIHLNDGLTEVQDKIEELETEIINAQEVREIPQLDFDMDEVLDPLNIEIRAKVRKQLRLVLKAVKYWMFDKRIFVQLEYFNEVLSHILVIDNKRSGGEVLYEMSIEVRNGERIYTVHEQGEAVFIAKVTVGTEIWTLALSLSRTVDSVGNYINLLTREGFEIIVNEDQIDWF
ncbi:recombinase family protein [Citrobacter sp. AATXR]|uniref:recombinase family protein n=1 Tax=Citrobacter sp. AATXR TaxID=1779183 RepID=UPI000778C64D|nr:recombinase family protein [Citrobacter sp. AATXR]KYC14860.1 resolvase [Citrobacter sp. AATXR]